MKDYQVTETACRREDEHGHMCDVVRVGCAIQTVRDTQAAAAYLAGNDVPLEVARRVLLLPHLRRRVS